MKYGVVASLLILLSKGALAQSETSDSETVQNLYQKCKIAESATLGRIDQGTFTLNEYMDVSYCLGFMGGIGFVLQMNCHQAPGLTFGSAESTTGARVRAFINWAEENPQFWNNSQALAMVAISKKIPCTLQEPSQQ